MIHVNITLTGKIQRVGFRFLSMQYAVKLGVTGFVMNLDKDKIYIEAEGSEEAIEKFKIWCRTGQCSQGMKHLAIEKAELKHFTAFDIVDSK
ncbi:MAG: acylphosphatase [Bacteroidota bacterium]